MSAPAAHRKFKFIGCEILYREACHLAASTPHVVDVEFLRKGLHDLETKDMVAKIQQSIDAADASGEYEAILLGYARCNDGLVGVTARTVPLVIPRAHDCITLFFGSRSAYREYFDAHPGTYYKTTGWTERNVGDTDGEYAQPAYGQTGVMGKLGLAQSYQQMVEKYGKENADFILESLGDWRKNYTKFLYLSMGICDEDDYIRRTQDEAAERNWQFEQRQGDMRLLKKLFWGEWDDDFVIVQPGRKIVARNDDRVLDAE
ncbi:MAG TPA: hypothetical protein DCX07_12540 [Phycisphaerales bacterium]|nr:hypothetical protein [Phycisphaerales bacterium]